MSVTRTGPTARRQRARVGGLARTRNPDIAARIERLAADLVSPDSSRRAAAYADALRECSPSEGARGGELFEALRAEAAAGRLAKSPEAHLAVARLAVERGESRGEARDELWSAIACARDVARSDRSEDRSRASWVNEEASMLFGRLGDAYQRDARWQVSRYYAATAGHRPGRLGVYRQRPVYGHPETSDRREATMGAPAAPIRPPRELATGSAPEPDLPPAMEGRAVGPFLFLELVNRLAQYIRLHRLAPRVSSYVAHLDEARRARDFFPAPPTPNEARALERIVADAARSSDPRMQRLADEIRSRVDFNLLAESSLAYWGRP